MSLSLTTPSAAEPLSTAEAKTFVGVDHSNDDDKIANFLLPSAREMAETITQRAFTDQTYTLKLRGFGSGPIVLPRPPLSSVSSITYLDTNGDSQTWASSKYTVETPSGDRALHGSIRPAYGEVYPATRGVVDDVTITFVAGYGSAASDVPEGVKMATGLLVRHLYDHEPEHGPVWMAAMAALGPYITHHFGLRFD